MTDIFLRTLPFFAVIALGYWSGRSGFFSSTATSYLTKFVFYFPLSAMIFRFAANLSPSEIFDPDLMIGYLVGCCTVYVLVTVVARMRGQNASTAAIEAQCSTIGNVGFLGLPMMAILFGEASVAPIMSILTIDVAFFASLIVVIIHIERGDGSAGDTLNRVVVGLVKNPLVVAITLGLLWSALGLHLPRPANDFLTLLSGAATPCALFAIGASLATKSAERIEIAIWLSVAKLVIHPICVAVGVLWLMPVTPYSAAIAIASAALPVAGNVYMFADHYKIAPQRASAAILISTVASIVTVPLVVAWVSALI